MIQLLPMCNQPVTTNKSLHKNWSFEKEYVPLQHVQKVQTNHLCHCCFWHDHRLWYQWRCQTADQ